MNDVFEQNYYKRRKSISKSRLVVKSHVEEIFKSVAPYLNKPIKSLSVLDVGSGKGEYSFILEKYVKYVVGVEPYKDAYEECIKNKREDRSRIDFYNIPIEKFNINKKFDLVLCITIIEHMPKADKSFTKIFDLLNKDGVIYLTAPNKLWPFENHYKLWFLSWLPLPIADLYMRITERGCSYKDSSYSKTYWGMKKFFNKFSCTYKFVLPIGINEPFMGCGCGGVSYKLIKNIGISLIRKYNFFWAFSKGFIVILKKN